MGFPKQLDNLVSGGDEFTLVLATVFAEKKQSILLVDEHEDIRFPTPVKLSYLEKRFFQEVGKQFNNDVLINIERYIKPVSLALYSQNHSLSFISGPAQNGIELKRKFQLKSDLTFDSTFEVRFFELVEKFLTLSLKAYSHTVAVNKFLKEEKTNIAWAIDLGKELSLLFPASSFFVRGYFSEKSFPELYYIYLTLTLLGPLYHYDSNSFRHSLLEEYKKKGGHHKKTFCRKFEKQKKSWVVELDSFEGLVYPQKVFLEKDLICPEVKDSLTRYSAWDVLVELDISLPWNQIILPHHNLQGGFVPYSELIQISNEKWLWRAYLEQPHMAHPDQLTLFLEEVFNQNMSSLPFAHHCKNRAAFGRCLENYCYYYDVKMKGTRSQRGIFPSLLRLSDAIMGL